MYTQKTHGLILELYRIKEMMGINENKILLKEGVGDELAELLLKFLSKSSDEIAALGVRNADELITLMKNFPTANTLDQANILRTIISGLGDNAIRTIAKSAVDDVTTGIGKVMTDRTNTYVEWYKKGVMTYDDVVSQISDDVSSIMAKSSDELQSLKSAIDDEIKIKVRKSLDDSDLGIKGKNVVDDANGSSKIPETGDPRIDGYSKKAKIESMVDDMSEEELKNAARNIDEAINNGPRYKSGYLSSGPNPEALARMLETIKVAIEKTMGIVLAPGTGILKALASVPRGSTRTFMAIVLTGFGAYGLYRLFNWVFGDASDDLKKKANEIITPDTDEVNCVQSITNYNALTDDQKVYVSTRVGQQCKNESISPKATTFANVNNELQIKYDDGCVEKITVDTGGLSGTINGKDCLSKAVSKKYACVSGNCVEDVNGTYTESTCGGNCGGGGTCSKTESDFFAALDTIFGNHTGASWNPSSCSGTYNGTTYGQNDF